MPRTRKTTPEAAPSAAPQPPAIPNDFVEDDAIRDAEAIAKKYELTQLVRATVAVLNQPITSWKAAMDVSEAPRVIAMRKRIER